MAMMVKSEENHEKRCLGITQEKKCVKRRRREHAPLTRSDDNGDSIKEIDQSSSTAVKRSSRFRGVSRHRWTGRFEAHLWDKGSWNASQKKKGKQGAYDEEESAARAYDLAALKYWGPTTFTNFPVVDYEKEIQIMQNVTREEYLASLRRKSSGFSRGVSKYRGVARHHHNGRWEARIGRVFGNKYLYLGTYSTQEEAAAAYDIAAIEYRGVNAVTNFDLSTYIRWLRPGGLNNMANLNQPERVASKIDESSIPPTPLSTMNESMAEDFRQTTCLTWLPDILHQPPLSPNSLTMTCRKSSSSPTALSLLLQSSVFRELVEKTSIASANEEAVSTGPTEDCRQRQRGNCPDVAASSIAIGDEYGGIFYDSTHDLGDIPFICSSNDEDLVVEGSVEYFERAGSQQSLWSNVLNSTIDVNM
ncbi:hypothetical protein AMTR_s00202p00017170 [Amborella trichopoda]|uniref:AP2/ERF domain-containing protein n=1 Tax=Amborella trichopoda TaxID=13333 RepID=W1NMM2_AMBTC|nr:hypothetical protein AMTR_s00202p00017170 [Amborella trichopoda]